MSLFADFRPIPVLNHLTQAGYWLCRLDQLAWNEARYAELVACCREPFIYEMLFRPNWGERGYSLKDAYDFVGKAQTWWAENSLFTFLLLSHEEQIAAAIDVKSADLFSAEIGYWCSQDHRGVMTNTVRTLCNEMEKNGYQAAHAFALVENQRSADLLRRAGFVQHPQNLQLKNRPFFRFDKRFLSTPEHLKTKAW